MLSLVALIPLAWLVPNHYSPWLSAWLEAPALFLALAGAVLMKTRSPMPRAWAWVFGLIAVTVAGQLALGLLHFRGDAVMVLLFVVSAAAAMQVGQQLPTRAVRGLGTGVELLALAILLCAIVSVGIALAQWTGAWGASLWRADLPLRERPFANVAQPNHFSTICFLGLCVTGLLFEAKVLCARVAAIAAAFLLLGMVMAVSRTGWLQLAWLAMAFAVWRWRAGSRVSLGLVMALGLGFAGAVASWTSINEALLLRAGRTALADIDGSGRLPLWLALLDALSQQPLVGYGWLQLSKAQMAVAPLHPAIGQHFDFAHNVVIDLMVWMGVPLGLAVVGLAVLWYGRIAMRTRDARGLWLMVAIGGFAVHAMLEYPHAYAYFLVPLCCLMGAAHAMVQPSARSRHAPNWRLRSASLAGLVLLAVVVKEYVAAEENYREFRFESARIGHLRVATAVPDMVLLTQLQSFLWYARNEAAPGLPLETLERMRKVAERYPYPPALFRYAVALAANDRAAEAQQVATALCSMHPKKFCQEGRIAWAQGRVRFPAMARVAWPPAP